MFSYGSVRLDVAWTHCWLAIMRWLSEIFQTELLNWRICYLLSIDCKIRHCNGLPGLKNCYFSNVRFVEIFQQCLKHRLNDCWVCTCHQNVIDVDKKKFSFISVACTTLFQKRVDCLEAASCRSPPLLFRAGTLFYVQVLAAVSIAPFPLRSTPLATFSGAQLEQKLPLNRFHSKGCSLESPI